MLADAFESTVNFVSADGSTVVSLDEGRRVVRVSVREGPPFVLGRSVALYDQSRLLGVELVEDGAVVAAAFRGKMRDSVCCESHPEDVTSLGVRLRVRTSDEGFLLDDAVVVWFHKGRQLGVTTPLYSRIRTQARRCFDALAAVVTGPRPDSVSYLPSAEQSKPRLKEEPSVLVCGSCRSSIQKGRSFCTKSGTPLAPPGSDAMVPGVGPPPEADLTELIIFSVAEGKGFARLEAGPERDRGATMVVVIEPRFEDCRGFAEGLAAVQLGGRWGFVDGSGRLAIPALFEEVSQFRDGSAVVRIGGQQLLIDRTGRIVSESPEP